MTATVSEEMHHVMRTCFAADDLARLMEEFETSVQQELDAVRLAFQDSTDRLVVHSHRLVSVASQFGFPELAAVARDLESRAEKRGLAAVSSDMIETLEAAADRALKASASFRSEAWEARSEA